MNIFSFCLYGTDIKYYMGMKENLNVINKYYEEYTIYIYLGKTHLEEYIVDYLENYRNVKIIETNEDNAINTIYRYKPILVQNIKSVIVRDADSCINERDHYCINDFIKNNDNDNLICQVIRDHYWHKSKIMGGLTMFRNLDITDKYDIIAKEFARIFDEIKDTLQVYGIDEALLSQKIYPLIKDNIIIYTNICAYDGEKIRNIDFVNNNTNFCGNVIDYICIDGNYIQKFRFRYFDYNILEQLYWLSQQRQYDLILKVISEYGLHNCTYNIQPQVLDYSFDAYYHKKNLTECMNICKQFYKYEITNHFKSKTNYFYDLARELNYRIIGTCDVMYKPQDNEIVIYYGNYPDDYMALPQSKCIYKNTIYVNNIRLDEFKSDDCWKHIDKIFIMGLENEFERMNDTVIQLTLMNAPLDRIYKYRAKKDNNLDDIYIGATKNHLDCLEMMLNEKYDTCLFLEDDFIFTNTYYDNKCKLSLFTERKYDYDICFLSASKYHERQDYDDLLILSKQICTTSSGYLINIKNIKKVYNTVKEGYELLLQNKDKSYIYCIDRYWHKLSYDNKVFIFKNKLGFQKPSMSKITGKINCELD